RKRQRWHPCVLQVKFAEPPASTDIPDADTWFAGLRTGQQPAIRREGYKIHWTFGIILRPLYSRRVKPREFPVRRDLPSFHHAVGPARGDEPAILGEDCRPHLRFVHLPGSQPRHRMQVPVLERPIGHAKHRVRYVAMNIRPGIQAFESEIIEWYRNQGTL